MANCHLHCHQEHVQQHIHYQDLEKYLTPIIQDVLQFSCVNVDTSP